MPVVESLMVFLSAWGVAIPIICALLTRDKRLIVRTAVAFVLTFCITDILKVVVARPRPYAGSGGWFLSTPADIWSFPSKHASLTFSIATSLRHKKVLGVVAAVFAGLVSFSRIYLGVHYLTDVIAGAVLGILVALASDRLVDYVERRAREKA